MLHELFCYPFVLLKSREMTSTSRGYFYPCFHFSSCSLMEEALGLDMSELPWRLHRESCQAEPAIGLHSLKITGMTRWTDVLSPPRDEDYYEGQLHRNYEHSQISALLLQFCVHSFCRNQGY